LAELLDVSFFDMDEEIESFFGTSIERFQNSFLTTHSYRNEAAKALVRLLFRAESRNSVIALPPSGLMGGYLREIKKDITYFRKTYDRAHLRVDITGLDPDQAALRVRQAVNACNVE